MRALTLAIFLTTLITVSGCQTKSTAARFEQATAQALTCQERVLQYQTALNNGNIKFTDERNALLYFVVQELARVKETNQIAYCDDLIIAMVQADSAKTQGLIRGGVSLGGIGLGLIGLDILVDGYKGNGGTSGDTWNVNGSRVVNKSGNTGAGGGTANASSSGTGLGIGNTTSTGDGQSQGGFQPRQIQDVTDGSVSNSGEQLPSNDLQPEQLPVVE